MKLLAFFVLSFMLVSCEVLPSGSVYRSTSNPSNSSSNENSEFANLMAKDKIGKDKVTAEVLTYLLNESDSREPRTAVVIENKSNCDMIFRMVRLNSNLIYNLPIARNSKNQFVVQKGNYTLRSKICDANYYSQKNVSDVLLLKLSNN